MGHYENSKKTQGLDKHLDVTLEGTRTFCEILIIKNSLQHCRFWKFVWEGVEQVCNQLQILQNENFSQSGVRGWQRSKIREICEYSLFWHLCHGLSFLGFYDQPLSRASPSSQQHWNDIRVTDELAHRCYDGQALLLGAFDGDTVDGMEHKKAGIIKKKHHFLESWRQEGLYSRPRAALFLLRVPWLLQQPLRRACVRALWSKRERERKRRRLPRFFRLALWIWICCCRLSLIRCLCSGSPCHTYDVGARKDRPRTAQWQLREFLGNFSLITAYGGYRTYLPMWIFAGGML